MKMAHDFLTWADFKLGLRYCLKRVRSASKKCLTCRYFKANIVYLFYSCALLYTDFFIGRENSPEILYIFLGYVHIINASLYLWMWAEYVPKYIPSLMCAYLLPDWANLVGSFLYWVSASLYTLEFGPGGVKTEWFNVIRRIELFASLMELIASFGWVIQWYLEFCNDIIHHAQSTVGRGFTFDDPDMWANITLLIAAYYYFRYNVTVYIDNNEYDTNFIFVRGDFYYAINALLYTICSMRDNDFFWFMPTNGRLPNIIELSRSTSSTDSATATSLPTSSSSSGSSSGSNSNNSDTPQVGWWHVMSFFRFAFAPIYFIFGSFPSSSSSRSRNSSSSNSSYSNNNGPRSSRSRSILSLSPSNSFIISAALKQSKSGDDLECLLTASNNEEGRGDLLHTLLHTDNTTTTAAAGSNAAAGRIDVTTIHNTNNANSNITTRNSRVSSVS